MEFNMTIISETHRKCKLFSSAIYVHNNFYYTFILKDTLCKLEEVTEINTRLFNRYSSFSLYLQFNSYGYY